MIQSYIIMLSDIDKIIQGNCVVIAMRILNRVERFRHVILDFDGVDTIGQACADEVFRVFAARHPEINIVATNESGQIDKMISRALSAE